MTARTTREDDSHAAHDVADSAREAAGTREAEAVKRRSAKGLDKGRRQKRVCCKEREDKTHLHPECGGEDCTHCSSPSLSGVRPSSRKRRRSSPQSFLGQSQFSIMLFAASNLCSSGFSSSICLLFLSVRPSAWWLALRRGCACVRVCVGRRRRLLPLWLPSFWPALDRNP